MFRESDSTRLWFLGGEAFAATFSPFLNMISFRLPLFLVLAIFIRVCHGFRLQDAVVPLAGLTWSAPCAPFVFKQPS